MIGILIVLVLALGVGGTITVADNAGPGDALFGVDQAVERLRINVARKEKKDELRIRFAEERVEELQDLVSDDDSESIPDDSSRERVSVGVSAALNLLTQLEGSESVDSARLEALTAQLNNHLVTFPEDAKIEISDQRLEIKIESESGDGQKIKIEERTDEGRIRIEIKDGSIEIKTKLNDGVGDDKDEGLEEIEAKVFSDKTIVEVELNDEKTTFVTSATTKDGIVAAILEKFPELKQADVESVLEIETEDEDEDDDEELEDQDDDDDDDSDDDDDDDDDNSGRGGGDD